MRIARCTPERLADWTRLRLALWPDSDPAETETVDLAAADLLVLLAFDAGGAAVGFAEARLRRDPVNGCDTSPTPFLEGLYVDEGARGGAVGRRLVEAVEAWARSLGFTELGSDALIDNLESHAFHAALGFEERERVIAFRKRL
jgi:aminoglycoside 6'-N-acetyltransferase I